MWTACIIHRGIDVLYQNELQKSFQKRRNTVKKQEQIDQDEKLQFEKTLQMQASKLKNVIPPQILCIIDYNI